MKKMFRLKIEVPIGNEVRVIQSRSFDYEPNKAFLEMATEKINELNYLMLPLLGSDDTEATSIPGELLRKSIVTVIIREDEND